MRFEDFRMALEAKTPLLMERTEFRKYAMRLYEAVNGQNMKPVDATSYFSAFEIGVGCGIYALSDLLVDCARNGTIVARDPVKGKRI